MVVKRGDDNGNLLEGTDGEDQLFGEGGNDILVGNGGNDELLGGSGDRDLASYVFSPGPINADLRINSVTGGDGGDGLSFIEGVVGSDFDDTLVGDSLANDLFGNTGDDTLTAGDGADVLTGGQGNDVLIGGSDGDQDIFQFFDDDGPSGDDTIFGFEDGVDRINHRLDFEDLAFGNVGGDALIVVRDDPGGDTIKVDGMANKLDESDFEVDFLV